LRFAGRADGKATALLPQVISQQLSGIADFIAIFRCRRVKKNPALNDMCAKWHISV